MAGIDPNQTARGIAGAAGTPPKKKKPSWDTGEKVYPADTPMGRAKLIAGEIEHQEAPYVKRLLGQDPEHLPPSNAMDAIQTGMNMLIAPLGGLAAFARGEYFPYSNRERMDQAASVVEGAISGPEAEAEGMLEEELNAALREPMHSFIHNYEGHSGDYHPSFFDKDRVYLRDKKGTVIAQKDVLRPKEHLNDTLRHVRPHKDVMFRGMSHEEYEEFRQTGYIHSHGRHNIAPSEEGTTLFSTDPRTAETYAHHMAPPEYKPTPGRPAYVLAVKRPHPRDIRSMKWSDPSNVAVTRPIHASEVITSYRGTPVSHEPAWEEGGYTHPATTTLHWQNMGGRHHFSPEMLNAPKVPQLEEQLPPIPTPSEVGGQ